MLKFSAILFLSGALHVLQASELPTSWWVQEPVFSPTSDEISVKDPSVIFSNGNYHLFYTTHLDSNNTEIRHASGPNLKSLEQAKRTRVVAGGAAPQVFVHKEMFYMICNGKRLKVNKGDDLGLEKNWQDIGEIYQGGVSGTNPVSNEKKAPWGPIDFWMIADGDTLFLFYALNNGAIGMTHQPLSAFPNASNWSPHVIAVAEKGFDKIFEAPHIYHSMSDGLFYMQVEGMDGPKRKLALYKSTKLDCTWDQDGWKLVNESWACGSNISFENCQNWTNQVSHPEAIRSDDSLKMNIDDINKSHWLFMGIDPAANKGKKYGEIPWKIGVMRNDKGLPAYPSELDK